MRSLLMIFTIRSVNHGTVFRGMGTPLITKTYQNCLSENFQFLEVRFSIYLNRRVFVMQRSLGHISQRTAHISMRIHEVSLEFLLIALSYRQKTHIVMR